MSIAEKITTIAENVPEVYEKGIEQGKNAQLSDFWDAFQDYGNLTSYRNAFSGAGWNEITFKPKYDIVPNAYGGVQMFAYCTRLSGSLKGILDDLGVKLDTSKMITFANMFQSAELITEIPDLIVDGNGNKSISLLSLCQSCSALETIRIEILSNVSNWSNAFAGCVSLKNLTIIGAITVNGFNVQNSNSLTRDSLMSIINALDDKSSDTSGTQWKVTIGSTNLAKLSADEIEIATLKGWEIV